MSINTKSTSFDFHQNWGSAIRGASPLSTLKRINPIAKQIGITRVAHVTGLDNVGIPVAIAIRPNARHLSVSQGKGVSLELAKVSALMESIESWHAENISAETINLKYDQSKSAHNLINPVELARSAYNLSSLNETMLDWISADDLMTDLAVWIPRDSISLDSSSSLSVPALLFSTSSNGLASGNSLDEATCHAIYELIERDSTHHWSFLSAEEKTKTLVGLKTINNDVASGLIEKFHAADIQVRIYNATSKNKVPTFICVVLDKDVYRGTNQFSGKGTHFDKNIAVTRAISEAAQIRLTYISGSRDDVYPSFYRAVQKPQYKKQKGGLDYNSIHQPDFSQCFSKNISELKNILSRYGVKRLIRFNHTRSDFNIPVVHVLSSQLRVSS